VVDLGTLTDVVSFELVAGVGYACVSRCWPSFDRRLKEPHRGHEYTSVRIVPDSTGRNSINDAAGDRGGFEIAKTGMLTA
jgi:hypothetical protein